MHRIWAVLLCSVMCFNQTSAQDFTNYTEYFINFTLASPRRDLAFPDLATYDGYPCEKHWVVTEDGYILGLFRIYTAPNNASCPANYTERDPIVLFHGLFLSSDTYTTPGRNYSHAYNLADACFDVWIANNRGNRYSRNHTTLDPNTNSSFWKFSFHEMGTKDTPAIIDYILKITNKTQVVVLSHSQGVTALTILCAEKPEYNAKIKVGIGMSPTVWLDHAKFFVIVLEGIFAGLLKGQNYTDSEILKYDGPEATFGKFLCGQSGLQYPVCEAVLFAAMGYDGFKIKPRVMKDIPGHFLAGTSLRNFIHWGQIFLCHIFRQYDYGEVGNLLIYGQITPPSYNLSAVTVKLVLFAGQNDYVAAVEDVQKLIASLPNAELRVLEDKTWGHLDFIYADDLAVCLTPPILEILANC